MLKEGNHRAQILLASRTLYIDVRAKGVQTSFIEEQGLFLLEKSQLAFILH